MENIILTATLFGSFYLNGLSLFLMNSMFLRREGVLLLLNGGVFIASGFMIIQSYRCMLKQL